MVSIAMAMLQRKGPTTESVTMTSRRGVRLAGVLHLPASRPDPAATPAVVLCHGMESTKEGTKHQALAARLSALGYVCLRFDFSYVGESGGRFEDLTISGEVEDLGGAVDFLTGRGVTRFGLVGSSLGGTVAVLFAGREPRVRALVTIAAVALPLGIVQRTDPVTVAAWRRDGFRAEGGGLLRHTFLDDLERVDVLDAARRLGAATLVTHGDDDRVVPVADAYALFAALPEPKALAVTPGCDHRYSDPAHLEALLDRTVDWMRTRLPLGTPA
jgi:putative redox protein